MVRYPYSITLIYDFSEILRLHSSSEEVFGGRKTEGAVVRMKLPDEVRVLVLERFLAARKKHPAGLSKDGTAVVLAAGIGYNACVSPDGDVFLEKYDIGDDSPTIDVDRSRRAQCIALMLGMRTLPELAALLPQRPDGASDCGTCEATGWRKIGPIRIICDTCAALGWLADINSTHAEPHEP